MCTYRTVSLCLAGIPELAVLFKVTPRGIELVEPRMPRLSSLRERPLSASSMLFELMHKGLYLAPQPRDADLVPGLTFKVRLLCVAAVAHIRS